MDAGVLWSEDGTGAVLGGGTVMGIISSARRGMRAWPVGLMLALAACTASTDGDPTGEPSASQLSTTASAGPSAAALDDRPFDEQLFDAIRAPDAALAALAIEAGADVDAAHASGASALSVAITRDDEEMVELLLDAGARVEFPEGGYSLVQVAATDASPGVVQALLAAGASPDGVATNPGGPLLSGAYEGRTDNLTTLLEAGADPNAVHDNGFGDYPPLFGAAYGGHSESIAVLLQWGADPTWTDVNDQSLAAWAQSQGHDEAAAVLQDAGSA